MDPRHDEVACLAPHVALRFSPNGAVHACCVNDGFPLGRVGEQSLPAIWQGRPVARLRDALDRGDHSLGCRAGGVQHAAGQRRHTHAVAFDRFPRPARPLPWPKRVEFALSNACNLECVMCNGDLSSSIRAHVEGRPPLPRAYGDAFFEELAPLLAHVEVAVFIGGEPFLSPECRRVWDLLLEAGLAPEVHVTTNGTIWNDRVEHYLRALRMNVAMSIDGVSAAVNESIRVGSRHAEVLANRDRILEVTRSYGGGFGLNFCLLRRNWHELDAFLQEADRLDVDVHVIPVHYPRAESLFAAPADELRRVVDALDAATVVLGRNAGVRSAMVASLRDRLERLERGTTVTITTAIEAEALDALRSQLTTWAGQEPVVVHAPRGVIADVEVPPWAGPLGLEGFEGRPLDSLDEELAPRLGPRVNLEIEGGDAGYYTVQYDHDQPTGAVTFRSVVIPDWGVMTATRAEALAVRS